jgi:hypothetical protein
VSTYRTATIYLWVPDLAERWGVTERTIRRWLRDNEIGKTGVVFTHSRVGRKYAWTESQVADLEAEMTRLGETVTAS